jgi:threonine dehydrogenase-like Zn-dependent dehydrogenase
MGAGQVIVVEGISERIALAEGFGADHTVDFRELADPEARIKRVLDLTDGWGADIVVEVAGHPRVCNEGLRMVGRTGRYLEIGNISPGLTYELDPSWLIFGNRTMYGMVYYEAEHLQQALQLMERTREKYPWDRVISHTFSLDQIGEAFRRSDVGEVTRAAIVFN